MVRGRNGMTLQGAHGRLATLSWAMCRVAFPHHGFEDPIARGDLFLLAASVSITGLVESVAVKSKHPLADDHRRMHYHQYGRLSPYV